MFAPLTSPVMAAQNSRQRTGTFDTSVSPLWNGVFGCDRGENSEFAEPEARICTHKQTSEEEC